MMDETFDRGYQAARSDLNAGVAAAISAIGRTIGDGLKALHRFEWNAPWGPAHTKTTRRA